MQLIPQARRLALSLAVLLLAPAVPADVVTQWSATSAELVSNAQLTPPVAYRAMALIETAMLDALESLPAAAGERGPQALEPLVASACHVMLLELAPRQREAIEQAHAALLARVPAGPEREAALAAGARAAQALLAARGRDGAELPDSWRPETRPGVYVATARTVAPQWPERQPWTLERPAQFRPGPPPALEGALFARDYDEIRRLGGKQGSQRSEEQGRVAAFWEASQPTIYFSLIHALAEQPGRDPLRNARLLARVAQALDDALIATFDAKYHYGFWRPVTALRNGDRDGNPATERDASWQPLIETPMHPEYPAAHCSLAAAAAAVLSAEFGAQPAAGLRAQSPTAPGAVRRWTSFEEFVREVGEARILDGVHFRNSTEVGAALGRQVGEWTLQHFRAKPMERTARALPGH